MRGGLCLLQLLLVDDEDMEVHGLTSMIKQFDLPVEVCATARNGSEGWQKALALKPDIIITDLRMPQMSGSEMIRRLHEEGLSAQFIIVSAFEDFDAARTGLEQGIVSYLLKPVNRDELRRVLSKCCLVQDAKPDMRSAEKSPRQAAHDSDDANFIRQLLFTSEEKIDQVTVLLQNGIFENKKLIVAVAEIPNPKIKDMFDCLPLLRGFAAEWNSPDPVLVNNTKGIVAITAPAFIEENALIDSLEKSAEQLLARVDGMGLNEMFLGISDIGYEPNKLPMLYKQGLAALEQRFHVSLSHILFFQETGSIRMNAANLPGPSDRQIVLRIQEVIQKKYNAQVSIESVAAELYLSPSHIRRLFKNNTGITIMDYLERVRMDKARFFLSKSSHKIQKIGVLVGYENPSYFNIVFKKYYGMTPGEYRKLFEA